MGNATYRDMQGSNGLLANRLPFQGNSMKAEWTSFRPGAGRLCDDDFDMLVHHWNRSIEKQVPLYVVYSYQTPIAWAMEGQPAYVVLDRFSVTTSKGQGYVRAWINYNYPTSDVTSQAFEAYKAERERLAI